jgi:hypothetical protein
MREHDVMVRCAGCGGPCDATDAVADDSGLAWCGSVYGNGCADSPTWVEVSRYMRESFANVSFHAGLWSVPWGDTQILVDEECGAIRVGVYAVDGDGWVADEPSVFVTFPAGTGAPVIVAHVESLTGGES